MGLLKKKTSSSEPFFVSNTKRNILRTVFPTKRNLNPGQKDRPVPENSKRTLALIDRAGHFCFDLIFSPSLCVLPT